MIWLQKLSADSIWCYFTIWKHLGMYSSLHCTCFLCICQCFFLLLYAKPRHLLIDSWWLLSFKTKKKLFIRSNPIWFQLEKQQCCLPWYTRNENRHTYFFLKEYIIQQFGIPYILRAVRAQIWFHSEFKNPVAESFQSSSGVSSNPFQSFGFERVFFHPFVQIILIRATKVWSGSVKTFSGSKTLILILQDYKKIFYGAAYFLRGRLQWYCV